MIFIFAAIAFVSTLTGGLFSIKFKSKIHLILGFTAGIILGLIIYEIIPEIFELSEITSTDFIVPMVALTIGFMLFHLIEKYMALHQENEDCYEEHHHHHHARGPLAVLALAAHSFVDGMGVGLAFQVSDSVGLMVAIAVIGHTFSDGLNSGAIMLINKNNNRRTLKYVLIDAIAPVLGVLSTLLFTLPDNLLVIFLGLFAGSLLYIGLEEILPEAHANNKSFAPSIMTIMGLIFIYVITQSVHL